MAQSQDAGALAAARYPKRKRQVVRYAEPEFDGEDLGDEEEYMGARDMPAAKKRKPAAPRPLPKRKIFPFLELPGEIRNVIYELCLTDPDGIYLKATTKKFRRTVQRVTQTTVFHSHLCGSPSKVYHNQLPTLAPQLLSVCKQINQEAGKLLYDHHFHVENPQALHSFLVDIGASNAALLKHLTMREWESGRKSYNHTSFTALIPAVNLVSFNTHGYMRCLKDGKHLGRQLYRDAFQWMEAVGRARGQRDAAADVFNIQCMGWRRLEKAVEEGYRIELRRLLNAR